MTASLSNHNGEERLAAARERMLSTLRLHVRDERVIAAMAAVPRERFVPPHLRARAYEDGALPIGEGQTISQPLIVALMIEALELQAGDRVLEVGTGSGYQAAVLGRMAAHVISVERVPRLRQQAARVLGELGLTNVQVCAAEETLGCAASGPYDAIVVAAAAPHVPRDLLDQLRPGGRLVVPVGGLREQHLMRATRTEHGVELRQLGACAFVPLVGRGGWSEDAVGDASRSPKVR